MKGKNSREVGFLLRLYQEPGTCMLDVVRHGLGIVRHGWAWLDMAGRGLTWLGVVGHGWTWLDMAGRGWTWLGVV